MIGRRRNEVLVVVPPNSNVALPGRLCTVTEPEEHSDWSNLLSLGALSLVSALRTNEALRPLYVDCTAIGLQPLLDYISNMRMQTASPIPGKRLCWSDSAFVN